MMDEENPLVERDEKGRLKEGSVLNREGYNGQRARGFAPWGVRQAQIELKYDTVEKLLDLFLYDEKENVIAWKMSELRKLNPTDAGLILQRARGIFGDDVRLERESFWDRYEGKPLQRSELTGASGGPIAFSDESKHQLRSKLLPELADTGEEETPSESNGS
jgi:hypothetical protein